MKMNRLLPASGLHTETHSVQRLLHPSRAIIGLENGPEDSVCDIWLAINGNSQKKQSIPAEQNRSLEAILIDFTLSARND